jgi:cell division protein ZapE
MTIAFGGGENRPDAGAGPPTAGPVALYRARVRAGIIEPDAAQQLAVEKLQSLSRAIAGYRAETGPQGWIARFGLGDRPRAHAPHGVYLYGPVGRGKSMLLDLFFAAAPAMTKRRLHFYAFMLEVHDRIERERRAHTPEPIAKVAREIAASAALLCFDEFQVNDIADAMILERLFSALFEAEVVVVATSNRPPDELYLGGLQRERFLPFVALLGQKLDLLALDSGRDYRLSRLRGRRVYHYPLDAAARRALEKAFTDLTDGSEGEPETLTVKARPLLVPRAAKSVGWFGFADLCEKPLAAVDYLAIAEHFPAVIVEGIPRLARQRRDAVRFSILVDVLYGAHTLFLASAEVPPQELYPDGDGSFEFARTTSRLVEMQSEDYIANRRRRPPP